jgi:hypothetical protein
VTPHGVDELIKASNARLLYLLAPVG